MSNKDIVQIIVHAAVLKVFIFPYIRLNHLISAIYYEIVAPKTVAKLMSVNTLCCSLQPPPPTDAHEV